MFSLARFHDFPFLTCMLRPSEGAKNAYSLRRYHNMLCSKLRTQNHTEVKRWLASVNTDAKASMIFEWCHARKPGWRFTAGTTFVPFHNFSFVQIRDSRAFQTTRGNPVVSQAPKNTPWSLKFACYAFLCKAFISIIRTDGPRLSS